MRTVGSASGAAVDLSGPASAVPEGASARRSGVVAQAAARPGASSATPSPGAAASRPTSPVRDGCRPACSQTVTSAATTRSPPGLSSSWRSLAFRPAATPNRRRLAHRVLDRPSPTEPPIDQGRAQDAAPCRFDCGHLIGVGLPYDLLESGRRRRQRRAGLFLRAAAPEPVDAVEHAAREQADQVEARVAGRQHLDAVRVIELAQGSAQLRMFRVGDAPAAAPIGRADHIVRQEPPRHRPRGGRAVDQDEAGRARRAPSVATGRSHCRAAIAASAGSTAPPSSTVTAKGAAVGLQPPARRRRQRRHRRQGGAAVGPGWPRQRRRRCRRRCRCLDQDGRRCRGLRWRGLASAARDDQRDRQPANLRMRS